MSVKLAHEHYAIHFYGDFCQFIFQTRPIKPIHCMNDPFNFSTWSAFLHPSSISLRPRAGNMRKQHPFCYSAMFCWEDLHPDIHLNPALGNQQSDWTWWHLREVKTPQTEVPKGSIDSIPVPDTPRHPQMLCVQSLTGPKDLLIIKGVLILCLIRVRLRARKNTEIPLISKHKVIKVASHHTVLLFIQMNQ